MFLTLCNPLYILCSKWRTNQMNQSPNKPTFRCGQNGWYQEDVPQVDDKMTFRLFLNSLVFVVPGIVYLVYVLATR